MMKTVSGKAVIASGVAVAMPGEEITFQAGPLTVTVLFADVAKPKWEATTGDRITVTLPDESPQGGFAGQDLTAGGTTYHVRLAMKSSVNNVPRAHSLLYTVTN